MHFQVGDEVETERGRAGITYIQLLAEGPVFGLWYGSDTPVPTHSSLVRRRPLLPGDTVAFFDDGQIYEGAVELTLVDAAPVGDVVTVPGGALVFVEALASTRVVTGPLLIRRQPTMARREATMLLAQRASAPQALAVGV